MADMATPNRKGCLLAGHSGAVSQDIADVNRSLAWHLDALPPYYRDPRYPQIAIEVFGLRVLPIRDKAAVPCLITMAARGR